MMKLNKSLLSISISCLAFSAFAQDDPDSDVVYLSPDEYTDVLIGEKPLPPKAKFFRLESLRGKVIENDSIPQISDGHNEDTEYVETDVSDAEKENYAVQLYFTFLGSQINSLGRDNVVRILSNNYLLNENESLELLDFIEEKNREYSDSLIGKRKKNCEMLKSDMSNFSGDSAVENFRKRESDLAELPHSFFPQALTDLREMIGPDRLDTLEKEVDNFKLSLHTGNVLMSNEETNNLRFFSALCDHFLSIN